MRTFSNIIAVTKNSRGVYCLDPIMGCHSGMENEKGGCFNECYAAKSAKFYGYDFSKTVLRHFKDEYHRRRIVNQISRIPLDFVRMGCSGDPAEDWDHTISVCHAIKACNKEIVIITRHWTILTEEHLNYVSGANITFNTSVSALDKPELMHNCLEQYFRLKSICKSVLRVVTCDFNLENEVGAQLSFIQSELLKNEPIIDTVLRVGRNNKFVKDGIIKIRKTKFLGKNVLASKHNPKTYLGVCSACAEMCGVNLHHEKRSYPIKSGVAKQMILFTGMK